MIDPGFPHRHPRNEDDESSQPTRGTGPDLTPRLFWIGIVVFFAYILAIT